MIDEIIFQGPKLTPEQLRAFEQRYGIVLPEDYRRFMLQYNGGRPSPQDTFDVPKRRHSEQDTVGDFNSIDVENPSLSIEAFMEIYRDRIPAGTLPIGGGACGGAILLRVAGEPLGEVLLFDEESDGEPGLPPHTYRVAPSFQAFLDGLYEFQMDNLDDFHTPH